MRHVHSYQDGAPTALLRARSGQCFSSEAWGGRSANRGQCAQACRLPYGLVVDGQLRDLGDIKYLLSPQAWPLATGRHASTVRLQMPCGWVVHTHLQACQLGLLCLGAMMYLPSLQASLACQMLPSRCQYRTLMAFGVCFLSSIVFGIEEIDHCRRLRESYFGMAKAITAACIPKRALLLARRTSWRWSRCRRSCARAWRASRSRAA